LYIVTSTSIVASSLEACNPREFITKGFEFQVPEWFQFVACTLSPPLLLLLPL